MKCSLATGGDQDYIELTPETVLEASDLADIGTSKFVDRDRVMLDFFGRVVDKPMKLRIYVSEKRPRKDMERTAAEIDATP